MITERSSESMDKKTSLFLERRSIRKYKPEKVKKEDLDAVLEAGIYAPSGENRQETISIVIRDPELIRKLSRINASYESNPDRDAFYGAPVLVLVMADSRGDTWVEDGSLVIGNMLNAAYAQGLGSCWIHRAKEVFETEEGKQLLAQWGITGDYEGIGHVALGYALNEPAQAKPRKADYTVWVR